MKESPQFSMRDAWNRASPEYLSRRGENSHIVSYGNLAPTEDALNLLGNLHGQRVLDIGCGGGQNAVAMARSGAVVTGLDLSSVQIAAARRLAQASNVAVRWVVGDALTWDEQDIGQFDLILAVQSMQYMDDPAAMITKARRLLRQGGTLLISIDHPLRNCFYDEELEEFTSFPVRSYGEPGTVQWSFGDNRPMRSLHRPLGQWIEWMSSAGLQVTRVVEATAPRELHEELWPEDSPLAPLRHLPHTAILVGRRIVV